MKKCINCGIEVTEPNSNLCNSCGEAATEEWLNTDDILNWPRISMFLAGNPESIRHFRIPKKYKKQVNELTDFIEKWQKRKENRL